MSGVTVEAQTSAVAVGVDGSIYVILRQSDSFSGVTPSAPWPKEQLIRIMPNTATASAKWQLDGVNSRGLSFLEDGTMVRLYMSDSTGRDGFDVGLYRFAEDSSVECSVATRIIRESSQ